MRVRECWEVTATHSGISCWAALAAADSKVIASMLRRHQVLMSSHSSLGNEPSSSLIKLRLVIVGVVCVSPPLELVLSDRLTKNLKYGD